MLVTISTYTTAIDAHIVALRLRYEGIPCFLGAEQHVWAQWSISVALGGVRVQVPSPFIAEAKKVVWRIQNSDYVQELSTPELLPSEPACLACSSTEAIPLCWSEKIALLVLFLYSLPTPYNQHRYRCGSCGHKWEALHERGYPRFVISAYAIGIPLLLFLGQSIYCEWCKIYCAYPPDSCY